VRIVRDIQFFLWDDLHIPRRFVDPIQHLRKLWEFRKYKPGEIFHSCSLHPCRITKIDVNGDNIEGKSLLDGTIQNCSLSHCGVYLMSQDEIDAHYKAWDKEKERGLLILYYGNEEAADAFIKEWRQ
jgi:hypothetical protein